MAAIIDTGLLWDSQAYTMGGNITSDQFWFSPGRSGAGILLYSTRAGSLELQVTIADIGPVFTAKTVITTAIVAATATWIALDGAVLNKPVGDTSSRYLTYKFTEGGAGTGTITLYISAAGPRDQ